MSFEPLRVDFTVVGLVGRSAHPIHLDAMIAKLLIQTELGFAPGQGEAERLLEELPLERKSIADTWVWAASTIAFKWTGPATQFAGVRAFRASEIANQIDVIEKVKSSQKIDTGSGKWKSEQYANPVQQASHARAYAIGDIEKIRSLLGSLTSIGAQRRHNPANVTSVHIEHDEAALELWNRRYLPPAANVKAPRREGSYRLPMFERRNQTVVKDNHLEYA